MLWWDEFSGLLSVRGVFDPGLKIGDYYSVGFGIRGDKIPLHYGKKLVSLPGYLTVY